MMSSVATVGADGALRMHCLPAKQAQSLVKSSKKAPVAKTAAKAGP